MQKTFPIIVVTAAAAPEGTRPSTIIVCSPWAYYGFQTHNEWQKRTKRVGIWDRGAASKIQSVLYLCMNFDLMPLHTQRCCLWKLIVRSPLSLQSTAMSQIPIPPFNAPSLEMKSLWLYRRSRLDFGDNHCPLPAMTQPLTLFLPFLSRPLGKFVSSPRGRKKYLAAHNRVAEKNIWCDGATASSFKQNLRGNK